jgi:hypothetical protein
MSLLQFRSNIQPEGPAQNIAKDPLQEEISKILKLSDEELEAKGKGIMDHISGHLKMMHGTLEGSRGKIYTRKDLAYATLDFLDGKKVMITSTDFNLRENARLLAAVKKAYYIRNKNVAWEELTSGFKSAMTHISE